MFANDRVQWAWLARNNNGLKVEVLQESTLTVETEEYGKSASR